MKKIILITILSFLCIMSSYAQEYSWETSDEDEPENTYDLGSAGEVYGEVWNDPNTIGGRFGFIPKDTVPDTPPPSISFNFQMTDPEDFKYIGCDGFDFLAQIKANMSSEAIMNWLEQVGNALISAAPGLLISYISPELKSFIDQMQSISMSRFSMASARCHAIIDAAAPAMEQRDVKGALRAIGKYTTGLVTLKIGKEEGKPLTELMGLGYGGREVAEELREKAAKKATVVRMNADGTPHKPTDPESGNDEYDVTEDLLNAVLLKGKELSPGYKKTLKGYLGTYILRKERIPGSDENKYSVETVPPTISTRMIYKSLYNKYVKVLRKLINEIAAGESSYDIIEIRKYLRENDFPEAVANINSRVLLGLLYLKNTPGSSYDDSVRYLADSFAKIRTVEFLFEALDIANAGAMAKHLDPPVLQLWEEKKMQIQNDLDTELSRYELAAKSFIYTTTMLEQIASNQQAEEYTAQINNSTNHGINPIIEPIKK